MPLITFANQSGDVPASELDDNFSFLLNEIETGPRTRLTGDTIYYVRTDGSDSNDGLTNTAAGAFLTPQGLIDHLKQDVDFGGRNVTINIADGTYANFAIHGDMVGSNQSLRFKIVGNETNPQNVVIAGVGADAFRLLRAACWLTGVTVTTSGGSGYGFYIGEHADFLFGKIRFGDVVNDQFFCFDGAIASAADDVEVVGDADSFLHVTSKARVAFDEHTITFTGTPAFTTYVLGLNDATLSLSGTTLVGDKTGRCFVHNNAFVNLQNTVGKILGTNNAWEIDGGGNVVYNPVQDTIYVRSGGSSHNDGYLNTDARAFATISDAMNWLRDRPYNALNSTTPVIQVQDGTWTSPVTLSNIPFVDQVTLQGNTGTPANVLLDITGNPCITAGSQTRWVVQGFKAQTTSGAIISAVNCDLLVINNFDFGSCTGAHIDVGRYGFVQVGTSYTISGGAAQHVQYEQGRVFIAGAITATISGSPTITTMVNGQVGGDARISPTWSGSPAVGTKKYSITGNAVLNTAGVTLPGSVAGTTATGGQVL